MPRKIVTTHVNPPIPWRDHDWCAYFDGDEDTGNYGYGETRLEAIAELLALHDDDEEEAA